MKNTEKLIRKLESERHQLLVRCAGLEELLAVTKFRSRYTPILDELMATYAYAHQARTGKSAYPAIMKMRKKLLMADSNNSTNPSTTTR